MTMWGDEGMEVDLFSALPGIQYFCEHAFGAADPMKAAKKHFAGVCGCPFEPWVRASGLDSIPPVGQPEMSTAPLGRSIASVLELKTHLRRDLARAYAKRDRKALNAIAGRELPELRRRAAALWKRHRAMWMATYNPFGWEVVESRYGTIMARLATLQQRLDDFLAGRLDALSEIAADLHNPWEGREISGLHFSPSRMRTPSCIS